jgi:hypothetical protein
MSWWCCHGGYALGFVQPVLKCGCGSLALLVRNALKGACHQQSQQQLLHCTGELGMSQAGCAVAVEAFVTAASLEWLFISCTMFVRYSSICASSPVVTSREAGLPWTLAVRCTARLPSCCGRDMANPCFKFD